MDQANIHLRRPIFFRINGLVKAGELSIGIPLRSEKKGRSDAWGCSWTLSAIDPNPKNIYGEDALSALVNCLTFLSGYIRDQAESGVQIWWLEEGDNAGLQWDE